MLPIRVLLVDDNPGFLESASLLLAAHPRIVVVGKAHSGAEALTKIPHLTPDLILIDLVMPEMNGLETTRQIKIGKSPPRVIILTLYDNAEYRDAALAVGADGFVAKPEVGTRLCPLICELFKNGKHLEIACEVCNKPIGRGKTP